MILIETIYIETYGLGLSLEDGWPWPAPGLCPGSVGGKSSTNLSISPSSRGLGVVGSVIGAEAASMSATLFVVKCVFSGLPVAEIIA